MREFTSGIPDHTPQCFIDLMKNFWDKDPLKGPIASDVKRIGVTT